LAFGNALRSASQIGAFQAGHQIEESMAVAIDGEIFQDAYWPSSNPRARSS
jgi:hypothetical protein